MIEYNITISLDDNIELEWLEWMKSHHIPKVINCGVFKGAKIKKILTKEEITYAVSYICDNMDKINEYQRRYAPSLQSEYIERYGTSTVVFRTLLEVVDDIKADL